MVVDPDEIDTMVRTLSGEARGESHTGRIAVAYVIRNRAEWMPAAWWGHTIGQICLKHSKRGVYQFSCWSDADWNASNKAHMIALKPNETEYLELQQVCDEVLSGTAIDPTGGATQYKVTGTNASWDRAVANSLPVVIGHHSFWRLAPNS